MKILSTIIAAVLLLTGCTAKSSKSSESVEKKVLVAYFSATGTTKAQAEAIDEATGATLYEITPAQIYTEADLDWCDEQSRTSVEMKNAPDSRPELGGESIDASAYDIVFVGFPNWWDQAPHIINTWIESQKLDGKTVIPFSTSGGSSIDNSVSILRKLYPAIKMQDGKLLNGSAQEAAEWAKIVVK